MPLPPHQREHREPCWKNSPGLHPKPHGGESAKEKGEFFFVEFFKKPRNDKFLEPSSELHLHRSQACCSHASSRKGELQSSDLLSPLENRGCMLRRFFFSDARWNQMEPVGVRWRGRRSETRPKAMSRIVFDRFLISSHQWFGGLGTYTGLSHWVSVRLVAFSREGLPGLRGREL